MFSLAEDVPFAELSIPDHVRPHAPAFAQELPLRGWSATDRANTWRTRLPIRTRNLHHVKPSPGMEVIAPDGEPVTPNYMRMHGVQADVYWTYDDTGIQLHGLDTRPEPGAFHFRYPMAHRREARLNLATSGLPTTDYVRATVQVGDNNETSRRGLLLPAPSQVAWDLALPQDAVLSFDAGLVEPEWLDGPPSDGATILVRWLPDEGDPVELHRQRVEGPTLQQVQIDLAPFGQTSGRLQIHTEPGESTTFDYVFLAEPIVHPPRSVPRRIFLIFIDTLRPDHLGAWGYPRPTSPTLDSLARRGVRFDNARSVAPWTLPSARSLITGQQPERYHHATPLPDILRAEGFATAMFAGNLYLGPNFGMERGWGLHHVELLPAAEQQVDRALAWLDTHPSRDVFMLLHFMDPHLPYEEPDAYRERFQTVPRPDALRSDSFHRPAVIRNKPRNAQERRYYIDRYDANIRYTDDQLARLTARLQPTDLVILVSDHGEEFWEHDGFEHGHTLYDEVLRVPVIFAGAGLPSGVVRSDPVSLLDIVPTVLDHLELPLPDLDGTSLLPVMRGDPDAAAHLATRPLGVGRPLYGSERWGVIDGPFKYTTHAGEHELYDLTADPGERDDASETRGDLIPELQERMGDGLGRPVATVIRLFNKLERRAPDDLIVTLRVPGGIEEVWLGEDPTEHSLACPSMSDDPEEVVVNWPAPWRGAREVFVLPKRPIPEIVNDLEITARSDGDVHTPRVPPAHPGVPGPRRTLARGWVGQRSYSVGLAVSPRPTAGMDALSGYDAETAAELEAMGYAVGDDDPLLREAPSRCP